MAKKVLFLSSVRSQTAEGFLRALAGDVLRLMGPAWRLAMSIS
jgi:hypothetical protein